MKWKTRSELNRIAEEDKGLSADPLHLYELFQSGVSGVWIALFW